MVKFSDRRGKRVKASKQKSDDYYRLRIIMFLSANSEARITDLVKSGKYGLSTMNKGSMKILLEKMIEENWVKKRISKEAENVKFYSLDKKGLDMVNFIRDLRDNNSNHPIFDCETYYGVKSLGLPDV